MSIWITRSVVNRIRQSRFGRSSTWLELNVTALDLLLAVTMLVGSASLLAMASGDPETMALVALAGVALVLVGTAAIRLSERVRTTEASLF